MKVTAQDIRKGKGSIKREPCFVCGKHREITQLHHVLPLEKCAEMFSTGIVSNISIPEVWLCPNCHAYVHKWIKHNYINVMREEMIYQSISKDERLSIGEIGDRADRIYYEIIDEWRKDKQSQKDN